MAEEQCQKLSKYVACDISDALLALEPTKVGTRRTAGYLSGLTLRQSAARDTGSMIVAPAYTIQFQPKDSTLSEDSQPRAENNIKPGVQWSDLVEKGCIAVLQQPEGQNSASAGGMHMTRLCMVGAKGLIVGGNIRDQRELFELDLPTFSKATSSVATGAESKLWARQVPITISDVLIEPGDLICIDQVEGVVRIPKLLVQAVIDWLHNRGSSDDDIVAAVKAGSSIQEAFNAHRQEVGALT